jgi:protein tyrosine/serine phosphatase
MKRSAILGLVLCLGACRDAVKPPPPPDFAEPMKVEGIPNLAKIHDGLYRGGQPKEEGFLWLKENGFRTVINLRQYHGETGTVEKYGMEPVSLPVQASMFGSEPPTEEQIKEFFKIVLDPKRRPVYFHCAHGKDRTGTMAALYRMEVDGWDATKAIEEMQYFGYHDIYKDLINFVRTYKPRGYAK